MNGRELAALAGDLAVCTRCPRLVAWREQVADEKRAAFRDEEYWGRPVPGFGDPGARLVVVGLAPAAHGANRTGRMFTGDRSGDWLYRSLFRAGMANQPESTERTDGLRLDGVWVTAGVRCAPPGNRPTPAERDACAPWLDLEIGLLGSPVVYVALGEFAYRVVWSYLGRRGVGLPRPRPRFAHGLEVGLENGIVVIASYHPSPQNTCTGRLTEPMLDAVFTSAARLLVTRPDQP